jgi:hypothetical protein
LNYHICLTNQLSVEPGMILFRDLSDLMIGADAGEGSGAAGA